MSNQAFELAILISLKDAASAGADRVTDRLRGMGKEGKVALKTVEDLRRDLKQGLVLGGVGVAGLQMLRGGIKSAGDFEAAMGDLRMSLEELGTDGRVNVAKLGDEMNRAEKLAIGLGNALPGTTQDFIEMMSTLKQGGLDVKTIMDGAGESVANLAVVTGNVPKQLAEPFSQYVQQFKLNAQETIELTNTLARLRFATGLTPQELIEGSKFFQTRAGMPLGLSGIKGADTSGRVLATLRSYGLEGGIGGRELGGFAVGLTFNSKEQKNLLKELKAKHQIELQFFNKQGKFLGFENVFAQMEKMRKLSTVDQLKYGEKLFGREGMGIASIMMKAGVDGWREINARIDKVPPLQELINQKTATYNAKLEAVQGTLENLKATTFTPILDSLKPVLDLANQFTGELQEFAKAHPALAGTATKIFGISAAALILLGSVKSLTAVWKLWKIASAIGSGEAGMLTFLRTARTETQVTANAMQTSLNDIFGKKVVVAEEAAKRTGGKLGGALTSALKFSLVTFGIEALVENLMERGQQAIERRKAQNDITDLQRERSEIMQKMSTGKMQMGEGMDRLREIQVALGEANVGAVNATRSVDTVSWLANPSEFASLLAAASNQQTRRHGITGFVLQGFKQAMGGNAIGEEMSDQLTAVPRLKAMLKQLAFSSPESLNTWIEAIRKSGAANEEELVTLRKLANEVYPQYANEMTSLRGSVTDATTAVADFASALRTNRPTPFSYFNPNQPAPVTPAPTIAKPTGPKVPSRAIGGDVQSEGLVHLHTGERILPARVTRGLQRGALGAGVAPIHISGGLNIIVPKGSRAAEDPQTFAEFAHRHIVHEVHRQRERR